MKFIKNNQSLIVGIIVFVLAIIGFIVLRAFLSPSENQAIYGSRLDEKKNYPLSKDTIGNAESSLESEADSTKIRVAGRIIEINIKVNNEKSLSDAKALGDKILENFSDKEKSYYDFQIFISKEGESNQFPIIGYKHHTKEAIIWTKDRAES